MRPIVTAVTLGVCVTILDLLVDHSARADEAHPCPPKGTTWIRVAVDAPESPSLPQQLLEHLRAELAPHGIAVCPFDSASAGAPLADIRIVRASGQRVAIEVQVNDAVTESARNEP